MGAKMWAAAVAAGMSVASVAVAAPGSVAAPGIAAGDARIQTVAYGCGPGWAPNAWGRCRPLYRPSACSGIDPGYVPGCRGSGLVGGSGYLPYPRPHGIAIRVY